MPKKPNFDFERREREKAKAIKTADRAEGKKQKKSAAEVDLQNGSDAASSRTALAVPGKSKLPPTY